jgi:hypothetical protein
MNERPMFAPRERFALAQGIGLGFALASGIVGELRREHPKVIAETLERLAMNDGFIEILTQATERDACAGDPSAARWTALVRAVIDLLPDEFRRGLRLVKRDGSGRAR